MGEGFFNFLSGLLDAIKTGATNTGYAIRDDYEDVKEGRMPHNISRDIPGLLSMIGQPSVNPTIPAMRYSKMAFDPQKGWYEVGGKVYEGGNWLDMYMRQGGFGQLVEQLLKAYEGPRD